MTENKRFTMAKDEYTIENNSKIISVMAYTIEDNSKIISAMTREDILFTLNRLNDENKQLKKEKEELQSKAKTLLDFYSKKYCDAIFSGQRHSKTLHEELWIVKEILGELGLYEDE